VSLFPQPTLLRWGRRGFHRWCVKQRRGGV
jgi:hypothetical protein